MRSNLEIIMSIFDTLEIDEHNTVLINGKTQFFTNQKAYDNWTFPAYSFGSNNISNNLDDSLSKHLTHLIYNHFYINGTVSANTDEPRLPFMPGFMERQTQFIDQIEKEIHTTVIGDPFWKVIDINEGITYISKNGLILPLRSQTYSLHTPYQPLGIGHYIHLNKPISDRSIQQFFFYIFGNKILHDEVDILRFYFNIDPEYVHLLVNRLTSVLNEYDVPFTFKCMNEASLYNRADNCVLYIDMRYHSILQDLIPKIYLPISEYIKDHTPLFTFKIAPGLAFAEDPGAGRSFGLNRCKILANLLISSKKTNANLTSEKITTEFNERGLQMDELYLRPYSAMKYYFPIPLNN